MIILVNLSFIYFKFKDFWAIGETRAGEKLVIYPSPGTQINETTILKSQEDIFDVVQELTDNNLASKIFEKHSIVRPKIANSGSNLTNLISIWVRLQKF